MKEFTKALKCILLSQGLIWLIFYIFDDKKHVFDAGFSMSAFIVGILCLIALLILYFVFIKKYIIKNHLDLKKFNIFLFFTWIILQVPLYFILDNVLDIIRPCEHLGCIMSGLEYVLQWIFMLLFPILVLIINLIIKLYKYIKMNLKK